LSYFAGEPDLLSRPVIEGHEELNVTVLHNIPLP